MAQKLRDLRPGASVMALFGARLRELRLRQGLSQARLGRLVHVSGDLVSRLELAERVVQPDLIVALDDALDAGGELVALAGPLIAPCTGSGREGAVTIPSGPVDAAALRSVLGRVRNDDHAMGAPGAIGVVLGLVRAGERTAPRQRGQARLALARALAEGYQLAGWMRFDQGDLAGTAKFLKLARKHAEQAKDPSLIAYVLGPNLSFATTYAGDPASGVEHAFAGLGWARRSGNHRLAAFTMTMAARAHARLGEQRLCLELLDDADRELDRHDTGGPDPDWLSVFDHGALQGHRGSCLLDLGLPDRAIEPLEQQDAVTSTQFVRNRVIWCLDRVDALLRMNEVDTACAELDTAIELVSTTVVPLRVLYRFEAIGVRLRSSPAAVTAQTTERLAHMAKAQRGERV